MNNFFNNLGGMAQNVLSGMKQMGQVANEAEQVMQIIEVYKSGGDPLAMLAQMAQNNPKMREAYQMVEGNDTRQLQRKVQNMAQEHGVDLNALAKQFGLM